MKPEIGPLEAASPDPRFGRDGADLWREERKRRERLRLLHRSR